MLVLTRKIDQGLRIFDEKGLFIGRLIVLGVERDRVTLGIDADSRFVVLRDELVPADSGAAPLGASLNPRHAQRRGP